MSLLLAAISEEELVDTILSYARKSGWLATHFRPAKTDKGYRTLLQGDKGYPDITLVHKTLKRVIFVECKSKTGSMSPEQKLWRDALSAVPGVEYYLWKPKDLPQIREVLLGHMKGRQTQWG